MKNHSKSDSTSVGKEYLSEKKIKTDLENGRLLFTCAHNKCNVTIRMPSSVHITLTDY